MDRQKSVLTTLLTKITVINIGNIFIAGIYFGSMINIKLYLFVNCDII